MTRLVSVNSASALQLRALFRVPEAAVPRLIAGRPFTSPAAAGAAAGDVSVPLIARTLDPAQLTEQVLEIVLGDRGDAAALVSRFRADPRGALADLAADPASRSRLAEVMDLPDVAFVDRISGSPVVLFRSPGTAQPAGTAARMVESADPDAVRVTDGSGLDRSVDPRFVVVQLRPGASQADLDAVAARVGAESVQQHRTPGLVTLRLPDSADPLAGLHAAMAAVNGLAPVRFAEPLFLAGDDLEGGYPAAPLTAPGQAERADDGRVALQAQPAWNLMLIRARQAWSLTQGTPGVVVGVVDTGVDVTHPALAAAVLPARAGEDRDLSSGGSQAQPGDDQGHGTFVAGVVVGQARQASGQQVLGVAPGVSLLPLRVTLTGQGVSYVQRREAILQACQRVAPPQRLVLNLSWKTTGDIALIRDAIEIAEQQGVVVVASAGNWPRQPGEAHYPSDYPTVLSVAAVTAQGDGATDYSFTGGGVDLAAPGGEGGAGPAIRSTAPAGAYTEDFGTSFAAPHVAGVAALVLSVWPSATPTQVREVILATCRGAGVPGLGAGTLDAAAAVAAALSRAPREPSGQTPDPPDPPVGAGGQPAAQDGPLLGNLGTSLLLARLNTLSAPELVTRAGMPLISALIIQARRPIASLDQLRGVLGLNAAHVAALAAP